MPRKVGNDACDTLLHDMRRSILSLALGIICTFLAVSAISVYVFHDVDRDMIGHLNEAFTSLCVEGILFTVIISAPVWLFMFLGQHLLRLSGYSPRAKLSLFLGIGVVIFQYPCDFLARRTIPQLADTALSCYLIFSILVCSVVLLRDTFRQKKLREALKTLSVQSPA